MIDHMLDAIHRPRVIHPSAYTTTGGILAAVDGSHWRNPRGPPVAMSSHGPGAHHLPGGHRKLFFRSAPAVFITGRQSQ